MTFHHEHAFALLSVWIDNWQSCIKKIRNLALGNIKIGDFLTKKVFVRVCGSRMVVTLDSGQADTFFVKKLSS